MLADVRARWGALPHWARWVLALYLAGFAEGTGDHVLFAFATAPALLRPMRPARTGQPRSVTGITDITDITH